MENLELKKGMKTLNHSPPLKNLTQPSAISKTSNNKDYKHNPMLLQSYTPDC